MTFIKEQSSNNGITTDEDPVECKCECANMRVDTVTKSGASTCNSVNESNATLPCVLSA